MSFSAVAVLNLEVLIPPVGFVWGFNGDPEEGVCLLRKNLWCGFSPSLLPAYSLFPSSSPVLLLLYNNIFHRLTFLYKIIKP